MRVRLGGVERTGRAVDLAEGDVGPSTVLRAVRDPDDGRIVCPESGPAHERVGVIDGSAVPPLATLAAVARSLGERTPANGRIAELRAELDEASTPMPEVAPARERLAEARELIEERRERVATLQGRLRAAREVEEPAAEREVEERLAEAVRALSEAETERLAAEEALDRARSEAREARDARERRLELQDRIDNAEREARAELARRIRPRVDTAVVAAPGGRAAGFADADPVTARLAAARVADLDAPIVLARRRFGSARAAAAWLDGPVVRV
ncbi:MAG: hypothetical protein V5A62_11470 [Haloarculaceae archaeon]